LRAYIGQSAKTGMLVRSVTNAARRDFGKGRVMAERRRRFSRRGNVERHDSSRRASF
jgi:hypothetical protein